MIKFSNIPTTFSLSYIKEGGGLGDGASQLSHTEVYSKFPSSEQPVSNIADSLTSSYT